MKNKKYLTVGKGPTFNIKIIGGTKYANTSDICAMQVNVLSSRRTCPNIHLNMLQVYIYILKLIDNGKIF